MKIAVSELGGYVEQMDQSWTFNPSQGSIRSIVNTSSFQVIENDELRNLLITWIDVVEDYQEEELIARGTLFDNFYPYLVENFDYDFNLHDPRTDLTKLNSFKFETLINDRTFDLKIILEGEELKAVQSAIDRIIELTESELKRSNSLTKRRIHAKILQEDKAQVIS